jgi:hypothetical protein
LPPNTTYEPTGVPSSSHESGVAPTRKSVKIRSAVWRMTLGVSCCNSDLPRSFRPKHHPGRAHRPPGFLSRGTIHSVDGSRQFKATVTTDSRRRVLIPITFDPDAVWGPKREHHVTGTINGMGVRAVIEPLDSGRGILLGPAWRRGCGISPGDEVTVVLVPEGPQRGDLAPDVAAALEAEPEAAAFFDSLAQFYRKAYLRWIDATKRSPDKRAARIAEMIELLKAGIKQRPGTWALILCVAGCVTRR